MKFLVQTILLAAAVNAGPLVNSTESPVEPTKIDVASVDVSEHPQSNDTPQSKTSDLHYGAGNVRKF